MTNCTVGGESCRSVTRVHRSLKVGLVTTDTCGAGQVVVVIDVARCAGHGHMRASQRKSRGAVVKAGLKPCIHAMTGLAVCRKAVGDVIWRDRVLKIPHVAGIALRG